VIRDGVIETARLTIRPFEPADAPSLIALFANRAVARSVGNSAALSAEDAALWISRSRDNLARYGYGTGAVIERGEGRLIRWAGFARPEQGPEQIIYGLAAACCRRGLGSETVGAW
jgi:[ribosomal protein S5]-alanine N-acetyltransferase